MPHGSILNGLLNNISQALFIISKHPLETLPSLIEEISEDETEEPKRKRFLQTIINNEDDKKMNYNQTISLALLQKITSTPIHKLKHVMFKKMLLKLILFAYDEKLRDKSLCENFSEFVYTSLLKKYIMKKAAEYKYHHLLASCVKYKSIIRVRVFGRFLGLYNAFDNEDLTFYMECFEYLQNSPSGSYQSLQETTEAIYIPYVRCVECIKFYEKHLSKNGVAVLRMKLDKMRRNDQINRLGVVNLDEFLEQIVETYNDFNKTTKNYMKSIYEATDLNDDGYLQYKEFELLLRYISHVQYDIKLISSLFEEYSENFLSEEDEQVKAISFENLCEMNKVHKIFMPNCIKNFTGVSNIEEAVIALEPVQNNLEEILNEFMWRFSNSQVWEDHMDELVLLIKSTKEKIESKNNPEIAILAYKLIDLESKRVLIEEKLFELVPSFSLNFL